MSKYINANKLIAEIERRKKCYDRDGCEPNDGKWPEPENCVYPTYEAACEAGIKYCLENLI